MATKANMKQGFLVNLYMLCLVVGYIAFARFVDVGNLGIVAKVVVGTLSTGFTALALYLTYRVTRQSATKRS